MQEEPTAKDQIVEIMPKDEMYGELSRATPYAKHLAKMLGGDLAISRLPSKTIKAWALEDPASPINLFPDEELKNIALTFPSDMLKLDETQALLACPAGKPTRQDRRIRVEFWQNYEAAAANAQDIDLDRVAKNSGHVSWAQYRHNLLECPELLNYFLKPPAQYKSQMALAQEMGLGRLLDILDLPLLDSHGRVNTAVAALQLAAIRLVDVRLQGSPTQKMINMNLTAQVPQNATVNPEKLDERIKELEAQLSGKPK